MDPATLAGPARVEIAEEAGGEAGCDEEENEEPAPVDVDLEAEDATQSNRASHAPRLGARG